MVRIQLLVAFLLLSFASSMALPVDSATVQGMKNGIYYLENEQYEKANIIFISLMKPGTVLPDEICFYTGKSLYHSNRKQQSIPFLYKYIELTDTSGLFYQETIALLTLLGEITPHEKDDKSDSKVEKEFISVQDDPCQGHDHVVCPICNGSGVIITKSRYNTKYEPCPYSDERGLMDCTRYKSYLDGYLIEYTPNE